MLMAKYRWLAATGALVLVCILTSFAQNPPPSTAVIRINVNLVQVDAVVSDNKGKPFTDLKAEDFEILQDGKPQVITNFAFIDVKDSTVRGVPAARGGGQRRGTPPNAPPPPSAPRPQQIRRTV